MAFSSLRPLRHRDFALVFGANTVSNIGSWMQTVAVGALVTARTGQAAWTGLVAAAAFLPLAVVTPLGGALADRHDRRRWLMTLNVLSALLAAVLAALTAAGRDDPRTVTAVVLLAGSVVALMLPFQQAMLPELVPPDDLLPAASLGIAQYNLGRVMGPALAGALIAAASFTWAFVVNAASFFVVVVALARLRLPPRPVDDGEQGLIERIRAGAAAAWSEPGCRAALVLISLAAFLAAPFMALIPAKAELLVDGGAKATAGATGILTTAQGVGAVLGALLVAPLADRFGRRRTIVAYLLATPAALVAYASTSTIPTATAALAAVGALYIGILSGLGTVMQLRAPVAYRARVLSFYLVALGSLYPLGALAQGALADRVGLGLVTATAAGVLVAAVALVAATGRRLLDALADPPRQELEEPTAAA